MGICKGISSGKNNLWIIKEEIGMLKKLYYKIVLFLLKLIVMAGCMTLSDIFFNSLIYGQKLTLYYVVTFFNYNLFFNFFFLIVLTIVFITSYILYGKNTHFKKYFLRIGLLLNIILCALFILSLGGFKHFDLVLFRCLIMLIEWAVAGCMTAFFLRPLLFTKFSKSDS